MVKNLRYAVFLFVVVAATWTAAGQATLDYTVAPAAPTTCDQITFRAIVTSGDPTWFVRFEWDFNHDGIYEQTGSPVTQTFPTPGARVVSLRGVEARGGFVVVEKTLTVTNSPPNACFSYSPRYPNPGELVEFNAGCSSDGCGTITSYAWNFQDGGTGSGAVIRHAFPRAGGFSVSLAVTDNNGATGSVSQLVSVQTVPPEADFGYAPASPSVRDVVQFQDLSVDPDGGAIVVWDWSFGDGGTSTIRNPSHQYMNGGAYSVVLTVKDEEQQTDTVSRTIQIAGPAAAFTYAPLNPSTQDDVQFIDQSTDLSADIASWSWNFGDGTGGSSQQNPKHRFAAAGTYRVQLITTSEGGATSSASQLLTVRNAPPNANFSFSPPSPKVGEMVTFSTAGSGDPDGQIMLYEWDFDNDGFYDATGASATRSFAAAGAHLVSLRATDNEGATDTITRVVPVQSSPPSASFTFTPATPVTGQTVAFNGSGSSDADGSVILYEWDFNQDGTTDATGMSVTRSFASVGVYGVSLKVTDNDGAIDVEMKAVPVSAGGTGGDNQPPVADFTFTPAEGEEVNLHEVVTFKADGSSDPDGSIVAYEWDFDRDGVYDAVGATVSHIFHDGGAQVVTLRVTDDDGAFGFKTRVVAVQFVRPHAEFTFSPTQPKVGEVVGFDASASSDEDGRVDFFDWDFDGDGETDATGQSVSHIFAKGGSHRVTLTATDNDGVTDALTKVVAVTVDAVPIARFEWTPQEPKAKQVVRFSSLSTDSDGNIVAWRWEFTRDEISTLQTPSHAFADAGTYAVRLTVTDNDGATASVARNVIVGEVSGVPIADFTYNCVSGSARTLQFSDLSTDDGTLAAWTWNFGDGTTSIEKNPRHQFTDDGTYTVTLTVTDNEGMASDPKGKTVDANCENLRIVAFPNPAAGQQVTVRVVLPSGATDVLFRVFDLSGGLAYERDLDAGGPTFVWNLTDSGGDAVSKGLYFLVVTAKDSEGKAMKSGVFKLLVR